MAAQVTAVATEAEGHPAERWVFMPHRRTSLRNFSVVRVEEFWVRVDATADYARAHDVSPADALRERLVPFRTGTVREIYWHAQRFAARAAASDLSAAAQLIPGGAGDDGFLDLCTWLVSQGSSTYEVVLADPDRLACVEDLEDQLEDAAEWSYVAGRSSATVAPSPATSATPDLT
ncbi:DUF4240 domain-containing protein [Cellulomonas sp. 179-A 9B4 NHS]|uniref:DUF4240 domain-containing protein n=1 Tax=Cellulomonas sp. 179-A 9B4 NHS TaxID=3142379 RepID=UPI0039A20450